MTPEAAYAEAERLVKKFKGLSAAERRNYNEAATRQGFILPKSAPKKKSRAAGWIFHSAFPTSPASSSKPRRSPKTSTTRVG